MHPQLNINNPDREWSNKFLIVTGLTQFPLQDDYRYKFYRYNYFYNFKNDKLDLKAIFKSLFQVPYSEFRIPAQALYIIYSIKKPIEAAMMQNVLIYIISRHAKALTQLVIERKDFIQKQSKILKDDIDNYYYSFKLFINILLLIMKTKYFYLYHIYYLMLLPIHCYFV